MPCSPLNGAEYGGLQAEQEQLTNLMMRFSIAPVLAISLGALLSLSGTVVADDECQPYQWRTARTKRPEAGDVVCRYDATAGPDANYFMCKEMADRYQTTVESIVGLNPELGKDCQSMEPNTAYCVKGYLEPLRAYDGKCGPQNGNATCAGTDKQCCNALTWRCGDSLTDCEAGTCYSGNCPSATEFNYSLDGKCGSANGDTICGGKWGGCCSRGGLCGSGPDFCDADNCQSGDCTTSSTMRITDSGPGTLEFPWQTGSTKDGTCGGEDNLTCDVLWGACCSAKGVCGSEAEHCGTGCQSKFGKCENGGRIMYFGDYKRF